MCLAEIGGIGRRNQTTKVSVLKRVKRIYQSDAWEN